MHLVLEESVCYLELRRTKVRIVRFDVQLVYCCAQVLTGYAPFCNLRDLKKDFGIMIETQNEEYRS